MLIHFRLIITKLFNIDNLLKSCHFHSPILFWLFINISSAKSMDKLEARAFYIHSSYSDSGTESATIPAPNVLRNWKYLSLWKQICKFLYCAVVFRFSCYISQILLNEISFNKFLHCTSMLRIGTWYYGLLLWIQKGSLI